MSSSGRGIGSFSQPGCLLYACDLQVWLPEVGESLPVSGDELVTDKVEGVTVGHVQRARILRRKWV